MKLFQKDGKKIPNAFCLYELLYSSPDVKIEPVEMYVLHTIFRDIPVILLCQKGISPYALYIVYVVTESYLNYYLFCVDTYIKHDMNYEKLVDAKNSYLREHIVVPRCLPSSLNVGVKCVDICGIIGGQDHMSGSFIVDFFVDFGRQIHADLELEDCSVKKFPLHSNQTDSSSKEFIRVSLKLLTILKTGNSWYGNHGFKVTCVNDDHVNDDHVSTFRNYDIIKLKNKLETMREQLIDNEPIISDFINEYIHLITRYIDTGINEKSFWKFAMHLFENDLESYSSFVDKFMFCEHECGISMCHPSDDMYFEVPTIYTCCSHGGIISFEIKNMWLVINQIYDHMVLPYEINQMILC